MSISKRLVVTGALVALCACGRGATGPQANGGVELAPDESAAIAEITYARVARERSCKVEGGASLDERMTFLRNATIAEINPSWCKSDVHPRELRECVAGIRRLPCNVELKSVTAIQSCNVTPLCGVPQEGTL